MPRRTHPRSKQRDPTLTEATGWGAQAWVLREGVSLHGGPVASEQTRGEDWGMGRGRGKEGTPRGEQADWPDWGGHWGSGHEGPLLTGPCTVGSSGEGGRAGARWTRKLPKGLPEPQARDAVEAEREEGAHREPSTPGPHAGQRKPPFRTGPSSAEQRAPSGPVSRSHRVPVAMRPPRADTPLLPRTGPTSEPGGRGSLPRVRAGRSSLAGPPRPLLSRTEDRRQRPPRPPKRCFQKKNDLCAVRLFLPP